MINNQLVFCIQYPLKLTCIYKRLLEHLRMTQSSWLLQAARDRFIKQYIYVKLDLSEHITLYPVSTVKVFGLLDTIPLHMQCLHHITLPSGVRLMATHTDGKDMAQYFMAPAMILPWALCSKAARVDSSTI